MQKRFESESRQKRIQKKENQENLIKHSGSHAFCVYTVLLTGNYNFSKQSFKLGYKKTKSFFLVGNNFLFSMVFVRSGTV